jgi:hypothetical protein
MCCGFPGGGTQGKPAPRETFWEAVKQLYRELFCGARWYD